MKPEISLIIPYYNESLIALKTLNLVYEQSVSPEEVIFVDSNSNDNTSLIIKNFINKNNLKNWKIINTNYKTPSEAKNHGISKCKYEWCAFMDFDIYFPSNWIENQCKFISQYENILISYGTVNLNPKNYFDRLVISQTYGIKSSSPVIPSSFIHKKYFEYHGFFLPYRSLYDKFFIKKSFKEKNNKNILKNKNISVDYFDINYAKNFNELFIKTLNYSIQTIYIKGNYIPYIYPFIFIISIFITIQEPKLIPFIFLIIFLTRGILIPIKKNKSFFKFFRLRDIPFIFIVGIFIDISKFIGICIGWLLKFLNKKVRLDHLYK